MITNPNFCHKTSVCNINLHHKKSRYRGMNKMGSERAASSLQISLSSSPSILVSNPKELKSMPLPPSKLKTKKRLSKQLSMCETPRDIAWERRRLQMLMQEKRRTRPVNDCEQNITDEDLRELKGCIELGFGFKEEEGQRLCNTLPALDLYFAVNRQLSPLSSPGSRGSSPPLVSSSELPSFYASPKSSKSDSDVLKILSLGDNPQQVKTRLRHWAQAVACSVMQSS